MDKSCGVNQPLHIDALRIHIRMFQMVQLVKYNHQLILIIVGMCESTTLEFISKSSFYYLIVYRMTDNRKFLTKFAF